MVWATIVAGLLFLTAMPTFGQVSVQDLVLRDSMVRPKADVVIGPRCDPQGHNTSALDIYPDMSRRLGEEGSVTLILTVAEDGRVRESKVQVSSGHVRLDEAAAKAAHSWHMVPGTLNGKAFELMMAYKLTFRRDAKPSIPCEGEIPPVAR